MGNNKPVTEIKDVETGKTYEVRDGELVPKPETTMAEHVVDLATTIMTVGASELMPKGK